MNCTSNYNLFLRANGDLVCWDDYGSMKILQTFDDSCDYGKDVFLGPVFQQIRDKLAQGAPPFPEFCAKCMCLSRTQPFDPSPLEQRTIHIFQVEPTILCNLDCPGCLTRYERKTRIHPPFVLKPSIFIKILYDLILSGIKINTIDFQGHGEPLLSKHTWTMVQAADRLSPSSKITICTNANVAFKEQFVHSGVDEMLFAIDGMDQESYVPYRVSGKFAQAFEFMRRFAETARTAKKKVRLVWKYVLFDHNDNQDQLLKAQILARDIGIDELRFMSTQCGPSTSYVTNEGDIPILDGGVEVRWVSYSSDIDSIVVAISEARSHLQARNYDSLKESLLYAATHFVRLFQEKESVPAKYVPRVKEVIALSKNLPENYFEKTEIQHVLNKLLGLEAQKFTDFAIDMVNGVVVNDSPLMSNHSHLFFDPGQSEQLVIEGWAVDRHAATTAEAIFVNIGEKQFMSDQGLPRGDVAKYFDCPNYEACGFVCRIPATALSPGEYPLFLDIVGKNGKHYHSFKIAIDIAPQPVTARAD